jgi:hypothetical protein
MGYIGCPTTYKTRHFFNNSKTNEDIAKKQTHTTDTFLYISHTMNVLLFKSRCNIFIGFRIIKEMPGLVGSGTPCIRWVRGHRWQVKAKAIPLQAWTSPEGSRRLRLPDFKTIGT